MSKGKIMTGKIMTGKEIVIHNMDNVDDASVWMKNCPHVVGLPCDPELCGTLGCVECWKSAFENKYDIEKMEVVKDESDTKN